MMFNCNPPLKLLSPIFLFISLLTGMPSVAYADYESELYQRAYAEAIEIQKQDNARLEQELEAKRKQLADLRARKAKEDARRKEFSKIQQQDNPFGK